MVVFFLFEGKPALSSLKPWQVLLKLSDFGLARETATAVSHVKGKHYYIAPEAQVFAKAHQRHVYSKRDVFSCGILGLFLASGDEGYSDGKVI